MGKKVEVLPRHPGTALKYPYTEEKAQILPSRNGCNTPEETKPPGLRPSRLGTTKAKTHKAKTGPVEPRGV